MRMVAAMWSVILVTYMLGVIIITAQEMDPAVRTPVNTTIGLVYGGRNTTVRGTPYFYYNGIPYAVAKRFQDPEVFPRREFPTVALSIPPYCPQWDEIKGRVRGREENCLHLSVYTRQVSGLNSDPAARSFPVLFIVSGKRFTSIPATSPDFFVDNDIVVVTVSYRVGAFGFLSTMDEMSKGNYGLLDLELALMWVKNNIEIFGGDPRQVTLMGQDSGASLVSHLLLNPRIQALQMVAGAITMSGSPLCPGEEPLKDPKEQAKRLAHALDCDTSDTSAIVNCLKSESLDKIVTKQTELEAQNPGVLPPLVGPVIDAGLREFPAISELPLTTLQRGNLSRIPLVTGVVSDEGALLFTEMFTYQLQQAKDQHSPSKLVHQILPNIVKHLTRYSNRIDEILALMRYHYFRDIDMNDAEMVTKATVQIITDLLYNECQQRWANLYRQASNADVFAYVFDYRGRLSTLEPLLNNLDNRSQPVIAGLRRAVSHGDDLIYLTNDKLVPVEDSAMQEEMTRLWSSFIQKHSSIGSEWNSVQRYAEFANYLLIDRPSREQRKYRADSMSFLNYVNMLAKSEGDETTEHKVERAATETDYELIMWIMVGVAAFLLVACLITAVLFVRQKKKTTFVTR